MDVKDRLRSALNEMSLKITQAADKTGIPYRSWQNYLSGAREPGAEALISICSRLGVSADWLLMGEGTMRRGVAGVAVESPRELALLTAFRDMPEDEQDAIQHVAEQAKRLQAIEQRLQEIATEVATCKPAP